MLGRTANGLYWMYRYLERAENISRLIETGQRIALTRLQASDGEWTPMLQTAGSYAGYCAHHDSVTRTEAIDWLLRSADNPSSVLSSIAAARQNARMVRTALTHEVWEAVNSAYLTAKEMLARRPAERDLPGVMNEIRRRAALVRGTTDGTLLRNEIYDFARIGTFLERADNTARILDVKYYVLLPSVRSVGSSIDNVQWETILRSVSARGGFRMEYGNQYDPRDIAHFLILDKRMPRSLAFCLAKIRTNLGYLSSTHGARSESWHLADATDRRFMTHDIDAIFDFGLHEFVEEVIGQIAGLGRQIEIDYRFYE
ncbi:MAG: alpha-E domain-containing protein [Paracoccaceae bacterium]